MQPLKPSRPTSIKEMNARAERGRTTEKSLEQARNFKPRPTDVIISPFAKSGTTWLQQMVHSIRTRGSMDFDEITAAVPWLEVAYDLQFDIYGEQAAFPRAYKSHMNWHEMPKGGRYIYAIRNPKDVLVSFYHFFEGWQFETGTVSLEEFAHGKFTDDFQNQGYWQHVISWWEQRYNPAILFLCYEEMTADLAGTVERVAQFIGIHLDDELREIAIRHSSLEFMKAHPRHFDEHIMREYINAKRNYPPGGDASKVRNGQVGEHKQKLSAELSAEFDMIWYRTIGARFGYKSYADLQAAIVALKRE